MASDFEKLAARAAPAMFVLLWSTGFVGTKYVLNNAEPLTYLAIRMAFVVGLMAIIVAVARPKWPNRNEYRSQRRRRHSGARHLSRRHGGRDRAFDSGGALGADSGFAADPDLDASPTAGSASASRRCNGPGC